MNNLAMQSHSPQNEVQEDQRTAPSERRTAASKKQFHLIAIILSKLLPVVTNPSVDESNESNDCVLMFVDLHNYLELRNTISVSKQTGRQALPLVTAASSHFPFRPDHCAIDQFEMRCVTYSILVALFAIGLGDASKRDIMKDVIPDETFKFFSTMTWEEKEALKEIKQAVYQSTKNGTKLTPDEITALTKEKSPSLYDKKIALETTLKNKVAALTPKGQTFIESLHITSVMTGQNYGVGDRSDMLALLRKENRELTKEDRKAIIDQFPKFKKIFAYLQRKP
uniref:Uncharacterized protein n=1 Tax=Steinernema glaseri TaxID=37863 RepID=A0A1I7YG65_9BILA